MVARPVLRDRAVFHDGLIVERVVWTLPEPSPEYPHGLKYRLYCGRHGQCLVRYDNERGKGDHVHRGKLEEPCRFLSLARLLEDFAADVAEFLENVR